MKLDFTLTDNLEILHTVKNVSIEDVCRVYCLIGDRQPENGLTRLAFDHKVKGRKIYITDKGVGHTFTTRKAAYVYLMKTYGDFSQPFRTSQT